MLTCEFACGDPTQCSGCGAKLLVQRTAVKLLMAGELETEGKGWIGGLGCQRRDGFDEQTVGKLHMRSGQIRRNNLQYFHQSTQPQLAQARTENI